MRKMIKALIWEQLRLTRAPVLMLLGIGIGLDLCTRILAAFNNGLAPEGGGRFDYWHTQGVWPRLAAAFNMHYAIWRSNLVEEADWWILGILAISGAVLLIGHADREDLRLGFPPRVHRLPLPSWAIASSALCCRMLMAAGQFALLLALHRLLMGSPYYQLGSQSYHHGMPVVLAGVGMFSLYACVQGITGLGNWIGSWLAAILSVLFVGSLILVGKPVMEFVGDHPVTSIAVSVALAFTMTLAGFHFGRRGTITWPQLRAPRSRTVAAPRSKQRPFASAVAAQEWFEWRTNGLVLPCALILCLGLLLFGGVFFSNWGRAHRFDLLRSLPFYLGPAQLVAAFAAGLFVSFREYRGVRSGLGRFLLTRPLHHTEIAAAKLRMAMRAVLITVALEVVIYLAWLFAIPGMISFVPTLVMTSPVSFILTVLERVALWTLAFWLLFWAWNRLNLILVVLFAIPVIFEDFGQQLGFLIHYYAPWAPLNLVPASLMVVGAAAAFVVAYRRGLLPWKTLAGACCIWALAAYALEPYGLEFRYHTFLNAGLAALALAPIALLPLTERRRRSA